MKLRAPRSTDALRPVARRDPHGSHPLSETVARKKVEPARTLIARAARESLPRTHFVAVRRLDADDSMLGRIAAFFERHDRSVGAALLGLAGLPGAALGAPVHGPLVVTSDMPSLEGDLARITATPTFRALGADVQNVARAEISRHVEDTAARRIMSSLLESPGFGALEDREKILLLRYIGGMNDTVSTPARWGLGALLGQGDFTALDAAGQGARLRTFVSEQPAAREVVTRSSEATTRVPYVIGPFEEVRGFAFRAGAQDALRTEVEIDGRRVPLWVPKETDATRGFFHTPEQLVKAFAALPPTSRALVRELVIEPGRNPEDAYWGGIFHDPEMRAYMTAGNGRVTVYPTKSPSSQAQLDGSIIHETGHLLAAEKLGPEGDDRWARWRDAMSKDGIAPSRYARRAMGEDFAETVQLYAQSHGTPDEAELRALFPTRFAVLDAFFPELRPQPLP